MERLVGREKRAKKMTATATDPPKFPFDFQNLPKEILIEIFCKLSTEDLSRSMCVSKPWRELIILTCLPTMVSSAIHYMGLLLGHETRNQTSSGLSMIFNDSETSCPDVGPYQFVRWCSRIMQCKVTAQQLLDCCNGLLLFCHREGKAEVLSEKLYYYYVLNPITKQCIAVLKPSPRTNRSMYACLAYDPSESSYLRIVQFQSCQLKVFSSESGDWMTLKAQLPNEVARATWERQSIYHRGAVYRLSTSGHLVKFQIDTRERVDNQVVAIKFPGTHLPRDVHSICVRNKQIIFASIAGKSLFIWQLEKKFDKGKYTYNWSMLHKSESTTFERINTAGRFWGIHPYFEMAIFKGGPYIFCYHYAETQMNSWDEDIGKFDDTAFPIFECAIPFACCLNKMDTSTFQRLSIPKIGRRKD